MGGPAKSISRPTTLLSHGDEGIAAMEAALETLLEVLA